MSKPRPRFLDYLVYLVVRLVVCVIQSLSVESSSRLAGTLAWVVHRIDSRHRRVADENLRYAFDLNGVQRQRLIIATYRHFCQLLIEIIHLPRRLHINNWRRHVELKGGRLLVDCLLSDRPLLVVTGHFGNWEMAGYTLGLLGFKSYAVARPLDNPYLDEFLHRFRSRTGQTILAKKGDLHTMRYVLAERGVVATLADQDAGARGLFVDFFGRPASTHKAIALLALEHQVPILVVLARNTGRPLCYQVVAEELILPEEYEGRPDAIRAITQRFTKALERGVKAAPEQYFWLHRRWKHQPSKPKRSLTAEDAEERGGRDSASPPRSSASSAVSFEGELRIDDQIRASNPPAR